MKWWVLSREYFTCIALVVRWSSRKRRKSGVFSSNKSVQNSEWAKTSSVQFSVIYNRPRLKGRTCSSYVSLIFLRYIDTAQVFLETRLIIPWRRKRHQTRKPFSDIYVRNKVVFPALPLSGVFWKFITEYNWRVRKYHAILWRPLSSKTWYGIRK